MLNHIIITDKELRKTDFMSDSVFRDYQTETELKIYN